MHYIRFLKHPRVEIKKKQTIVRVLVTIATDLGDSFLAADVTIHILIIQDKAILCRRELQWKSGMRSLPVELIPSSPFHSKASQVMLVSSEADPKASVLSLGIRELPEIVNLWSEPFTLGNNHQPSKFERRLSTATSVTLAIDEDPGESIARHLWDGGIVLSAVLLDVFLSSKSSKPDMTAHTSLKDFTRPKARTIELGSGCGLVGVQIAHMCFGGHITLTDLPGAMDILSANVLKAELPRGSAVATLALDWTQPLPASIASQKFDVIVVSDCTYNTNSIPALVETLSSLVACSPTAVIIIATKVRHDSEAVFHEYLAKARIEQLEHHSYNIPDMERRYSGQDLQAVDIYVYRKSKLP